MSSAGNFDSKHFRKLLDEIFSLISLSDLERRVGSKPKVNALRSLLIQAANRFLETANRLDETSRPEFVLDPANPNVVGRVIALALLAQPRIALSAIQPFYGSGVYALYYKGEFSAYTLIVGTDHPIYVGKADPSSPDAMTPEEQGKKLYQRLKEHRESITEAKNLDVDDFDCRYLVVRSAWQSTAESYLIRMFLPIWNNEVKICKGFGKHGDSASVRKNTRSPWDTLHPGRPWAEDPENTPNPKSVEAIVLEIERHFTKHKPFEAVNELLTPEAWIRILSSGAT